MTLVYILFALAVVSLVYMAAERYAPRLRRMPAPPRAENLNGCGASHGDMWANHVCQCAWPGCDGTYHVCRCGSDWSTGDPSNPV